MKMPYRAAVETDFHGRAEREVVSVQRVAGRGTDCEEIQMASVSTLEDTATTLETATANDEEQLVTMIVDKQLFGIPILQVQDIVEATKITPVPLAPSAIAGVLNLRGRIVKVIDLRKLLGNFEELPWDSQMGVTVEYQGDLYTLLVDAIGDVRTLSRRDFDSSPSTMEDNIRQLCSGIYRLRGNLLVVLDVSRILINEVIEATPVITVAERTERKDAATANSKKDESKGDQLSARMTDLNAYETEVDSDADGETSASEDIKERKKANRSRKPITERWQTVLDERARQAGQVVYRMNEPDEETVETALEEKATEDAKWDAELQDKLAKEQTADTPAVPDESPVYDPYGKRDLGMTTPQEPKDFADSAKDATPDEPMDLADFAKDATPDEPTDLADSAKDATPDEPMDLTDFAKDATPEEPAVPEEPSPEATFEPPLPDITPDEPKAADEPVISEIPSDEPAMPEIPSDLSAMPESVADAPSPDDSADTGSVVGGWWNKLRGISTDTPADEAKTDTPVDEAKTDTPVDEAKTDTPEADDKPAKGKAKSSRKAKSQAKAKSKSKSKKK